MMIMAQQEVVGMYLSLTTNVLFRKPQPLNPYNTDKYDVEQLIAFGFYAPRPRSWFSLPYEDTLNIQRLRSPILFLV